MFKNLILETNDQFLTITISRPDKLNALSVAVLSELKELLMTVKGDRSIRGVILSGAGDKAFVAGADIKEMDEMTSVEGGAFAGLGQEVTRLLEELPVPVIACVGGFALGGGCELAMACDFIYAIESASFGQPEVSLGLIPGFGGCVRLVRYVGPGRAKELIYTGRRISAREAKEIGLVNEIFSNQTEMREAAQKTLQIISLQSGNAVSICKDTINSSFGLPTSTALYIEKSGFESAFQHPEKAEGVSAFLEKRKPDYCSSQRTGIFTADSHSLSFAET